MRQKGLLNSDQLRKVINAKKSVWECRWEEVIPNQRQLIKRNQVICMAEKKQRTEITSKRERGIGGVSILKNSMLSFLFILGGE